MVSYSERSEAANQSLTRIAAQEKEGGGVGLDMR